MVRKLGQCLKPLGKAKRSYTLLFNKINVDLRFLVLSENFKLLCCEAVLQAKTQLNKDLWLAD